MFLVLIFLWFLSMDKIDKIKYFAHLELQCLSKYCDMSSILWAAFAIWIVRCLEYWIHTEKCFCSGGSKFWHVTNIGASRDDQNGRCMKIVLASNRYGRCLNLTFFHFHTSWADCHISCIHNQENLPWQVRYLIKLFKFSFPLSLPLKGLHCLCSIKRSAS